jgi:hypothetical protein
MKMFSNAAKLGYSGKMNKTTSIMFPDSTFRKLKETNYVSWSYAI